MSLSVRPLERIRLSVTSPRAQQALADEKTIQDFQAYLQELLADKPRPTVRSPRLAPFHGVRLNAAVPKYEPGLAVFDAVPFRPRRVTVPPGVPAGPLPYGQIGGSAEKQGRRCPSCGWTDVRRSTAHNFSDYVLSVVGLVPYRCRTCSDRFHRARQTAPSPGRLSPEVSITPSRTLKIPGNLSSHGSFAAGTYSRALASMAATPGMRAARPAE